MYLDAESNDRIAQGKVIAFLLMGRNPCPLNVIFAAEKLQLQPEEISAALRALEVEGRIELVLTRAIVTLKDVPSTPDPKRESIAIGSLDLEKTTELPPESKKKGVEKT